MSYSIDVNEDNFEEAVIEKSYEKPVVIDFWAQWCGPCQILKPILEKLAQEYGFVLAKVNVDENQNLAHQFGVQGIPDVKIMINGKVVDEFVGALPESKIREILSKHIKTDVDKLLEEAKIEVLNGNREKAEEIFRYLLDKHPQNKKVILEAAKFFINENKLDIAQKLIDEIKEYDREYFNEAQAIKELITFKKVCESSQPETELDKLFKEASCAVLEGDYKKALDLFLKIVQTDRKYRDDGARKAMIAIFNLLGENDPLTKEYRKKLAMALY
ncbi:MAG: thioredoxin [Aquificae bacterium]|nr:thioredoxin [Aquificota bacterium]